MKRKPGLPVWLVSLGPPIARLGATMLAVMLLLSLMLFNREELARVARRETERYAKGRPGQELLTYNRASREDSLAGAGL